MKKIRFAVELLLILTLFSMSVQAQTWYRANLHTHTWWSDGQAFPEESLALYRDAGYQIVALTDHNVLPLRTDKWEEYGPGKRITPDRIERFKKRYPQLVPETKEENGKTLVRLRPFPEASRMLEESRKRKQPGRNRSGDSARRSLVLQVKMKGRPGLR